MRVISGSARGVQLRTPDGLKTRPTADRVKEAMFSIIQFDIPCARVLDLFGGTGQLGIEALSRGAAYCCFIDELEQACKLIKDNLAKTKLSEKAKVICSDYSSFLKNTTEKFDIIFLDPPYAEVFLENSLKIITEIDILQSGGIIATEYPYGKVLPAVYTSRYQTKEYKYGKTVLTIFRSIE